MIGGIILAAGSSRRFGDDKRKSTLPSGEAMLEESIRKAISALDEVLVVLRFGDREYSKQLEVSIDNANVSFLCAPDSAQGMAHSLSNAIHHVKDWEAAIVFLGDMPFVQAETIDAIMGEYQFRKANKPIILPTKEGEKGHPVLFSRDYFDEIQGLKGDKGARAVVDAHPDKLFTIEVLDPGVIRDIDTPDDLGNV